MLSNHMDRVKGHQKLHQVYNNQDPDLVVQAFIILEGTLFSNICTKWVDLLLQKLKVLSSIAMNDFRYTCDQEQVESNLEVCDPNEGCFIFECVEHIIQKVSTCNFLHNFLLGDH